MVDGSINTAVWLTLKATKEGRTGGTLGRVVGPFCFLDFVMCVIFMGMEEEEEGSKCFSRVKDWPLGTWGHFVSTTDPSTSILLK